MLLTIFVSLVKLPVTAQREKGVLCLQQEQAVITSCRYKYAPPNHRENELL